MFRKLDTWHHTQTGWLVFGLAELGFGYVFASWAINDGNLLDYFLTLVLLIGGLQNLAKLIYDLIGRRTPHGH